MKRLTHILPIVLLALVWLIVVVTNMHPNTWLSGWDNLHPEFNFPLNISRSIFAVWQEYQGLGLLGGMGHAAALPRELILWIWSLVIPTQYIRYAWTFAMLLAGILGTYTLIWHILDRIKTPWIRAFAASAGALYFLFNLATVQTFFAPFEAFVTHYGFLPWLLWSDLLVLEKPSKRRTILTSFLHTIGATQAYIPTLFVVYGILLGTLCIDKMMRLGREWFMIFKRIILLAFIIFCTNAYWMGPFGFFTFTQSQVTVNAKINQMATDQIYQRNQEYGTVWDTLMLRNFWYSNTDYNPQTSQMEYMLSDWTKLDHNSSVTVARVITIALILSAAVYAITVPSLRVWVYITLLGFTFVASGTPPFSWLDTALRDHVPLLKQFFRFPFTKWSIALALGYGVLLGIAVSHLLSWLKTRSWIQIAIAVLCIGAPVVGAIGILQGHLISSRVEIKIPQEYFQTFDYFKTQPQGRIALLPQPSYWDWKYYAWGELGSGFPWYGIQQPVLDRAFDVWSSQDENYYWELSYAIYQKNPTVLADVLHKYNVRYIMIDSSLVLTSNDRALFIDDTEALLAQIPEYRIDQKYGHITIYVQTSPTDQSFVQLTHDLPVVSPHYSWTDNDMAYQLFGDYRTPNNPISNTGIVFPYRSLFTKRAVDERDFHVNQTNENITISSTNPIDSDLITLSLKTNLDYTSSDHPEDLSPANFKACGLLSTGQIQATPMTQGLTLKSLEEPGCLSFGISELLHNQAYLVAVESRHDSGRQLMISFINQTAKHVELEAYLPDKSTWETTYFILPPLASDGQGYTVYLTNESIGNVITVNDIKNISFYTFPYQQMVSFHLPETNTAPSKLNDNPTASIISVSHPNPSYYEVIAHVDGQPTTLLLSQSYDPSWRAYEVPCAGNRIVCQISKTFPFVFGKELSTHTEINNWENGWVLDGSSIGNPDIVIFYLPQLLEYAGFGCFAVLLGFIIWKRPQGQDNS